MVWVIDTNKTLSFTSCNTTVSERSKQWGILSSWETFSPHAHDPVKNILRNYLQ